MKIDEEKYFNLGIRLYIFTLHFLTIFLMSLLCFLVIICKEYLYGLFVLAPFLFLFVKLKEYHELKVKSYETNKPLHVILKEKYYNK